MPVSPHTINSQAYEWVFAHGLCDALGRFDESIRQDGIYIPELVCDDLFAELVVLTATAEWRGNHGEELMVAAVRFPDNSVVWWTDDWWGIADGDGQDSTEDWSLSERFEGGGACGE